MKIIDAHLHLFKNENGRAEEMANAVGHSNSVEHLREVYRKLGIVHGVIMGNGGLEIENHNYPSDMFHYCVGLDSSLMADGQKSVSRMAEQIEAHLQRELCCGVKLYPGYNKISLSDELYQPVYDLAAKYNKPVAVHMGLTSFSRAHLKYCHPLALDEVAADNPDTQFVMCHFGNPFFESSAAVVLKNPNVYGELSGMLEGRINIGEYMKEQAGYVGALKAWIYAVNDWDKFMFGTDWPIVNLGEYIEFFKNIIPQNHWDRVFFENANRVYHLGL